MENYKKKKKVRFKLFDLHKKKISSKCCPLQVLKGYFKKSNNKKIK